MLPAQPTGQRISSRKINPAIMLTVNQIMTTCEMQHMAMIKFALSVPRSPFIPFLLCMQVNSVLSVGNVHLSMI